MDTFYKLWLLTAYRPVLSFGINTSGTCRPTSNKQLRENEQVCIKTAAASLSTHSLLHH